MNKSLLRTAAAAPLLAMLLAGTAGLAPLSTDPAQPLAANLVVIAPVEKVVTIDGRAIRITLTVQHELSDIRPDRQAPTLVNVKLDTVDGNTIPADLSVTRIRLQRVGSPQRVFHHDLTAQAQIPEDIDHAEFAADTPLSTVVLTRFRAALRIEHNGRVTIVPMGVVRILPRPITTTAQ